jgi:hypothetical protein
MWLQQKLWCLLGAFILHFQRDPPYGGLSTWFKRRMRPKVKITLLWHLILSSIDYVQNVQEVPTTAGHYQAINFSQSKCSKFHPTNKSFITKPPFHLNAMYHKSFEIEVAQSLCMDSIKKLTTSFSPTIFLLQSTLFYHSH